MVTVAWWPACVVALRHEEVERLGDELIVELEDAAVARVGVHDQFRVRETPRQIDRVARGHHPVALAVRNEHRLSDDGQVGRLLRAPAVDGFELRAGTSDSGPRSR